jgi:hypothetical protein
MPPIVRSRPLRSTRRVRRVDPQHPDAISSADAGEALPDLRLIAAEIGLSEDQMRAGVSALTHAQPPYIDVSYAGGSAIGHVDTIYERTRRELGTWPSAPNLVDQIAAALADAADAEDEPERKGKLRAAAETVGGMARDIAVQVLSTRLGTIE